MYQQVVTITPNCKHYMSYAWPPGAHLAGCEYIRELSGLAKSSSASQCKAKDEGSSYSSSYCHLLNRSNSEWLTLSMDVQ